MPDVQITLTISDNGTLSVIDQTGNKLTELDQQASKTADNGFGNLVKGISNFVGEAQGAIGILVGAGAMIESLIGTGEAAQRATLGLNALTDGHADTYIAAMKDNAHGLISEMDMASLSANALALGVVHSANEMGNITRIGSTLGEVFSGDAAGGVNTLEMALERVGNTRALLPLHVDIQAVKAEYNALVSSGIDKTTAWDQSVLDITGTMANKLQPAMDANVTSVDRLNVAIKDLESHAGENVAIGVTATIQFVHDALTPADGTTGNGQDNFPTGGPLSGILKTLLGGQVTPNHPAIRDSSDHIQIPKLLPYDGGVDLPGGGSYVSPDQSNMWFTPSNVDTPQDEFQMWQTERMRKGRNGSDVLIGSAEQSFNQSQQIRDTLDQQNQIAALDAYAAAQKAAADAEDRRVTITLSMYPAMLKAAEAQDTLSASTMNARVGPTKDGGIKTEGEAFGLYSDALYKQGDTQLGSDIAAYDKKHGIKETAVQKEAMDNYLIATGQATEASLKFDEAHQRLSDAAQKGKISWTEEANALALYSNMAKDGTANLTNLQQVEDYISHPHIKAPQTADSHGGLGASLAGIGDNRVGPDGKPVSASPANADDPFLAIKQHADDANTSASAMNNSVSRLPSVASVAASGVMQALTPLAGSFHPAHQAVDVLISKLHAATNALKGTGGTITVTATPNVAGNSGLGPNG